MALLNYPYLCRKFSEGYKLITRYTYVVKTLQVPSLNIILSNNV